MSAAAWFPPAEMGFAGRVAACLPISKQGRQWHEYVHWSHATRETLEQSARMCALGTWRRAWVDTLLDRYGHLLALGLTLGDVADRGLA